VTEYVYNTDGSVQKQINEATTSIYEYYPDKKLKLLTTKDVNDILIEENYYEYDSNNNITKENDKIYTYDALNRIKTSNGTEYDYDSAGNILTKSILEGNTIKTIGYSYNAKNQLLSTATLENTTVISESTFTYDDNGNQLTEITDGQTTTNTYNSRNELIQVNDGQVSEYKYNAEGKRIQKITDTTINFVYDGDNILLELDDQNNQVATNTYGLSLIKRTTDKEGYYLYNGHGDVTKIVDNTNNILNSYVYDEFGKILQENETFNNPYKYAGYYYDKETKTYYLQARYYNPEIQRFISEDTYRGNIDDPLSLNLYTYCKNNPMIYVDPSGHIPVPLITALLGGFLNTGINFVSDLLDDGQINNGVGTYIGAFAEGAIVGGGFGLLGTGATVAQTATVAMTYGAAGNGFNQLISNGNIDLRNAGISAVTTTVGALTFGVGGNVTSTGIKKVASYALKGFNAGGYANLTNQALTKGIEHINPMETLFAGVGGAIISPIAVKVGEAAVNKFGNVKTNLQDRLLGEYGELVKSKANDSHHIIQNAAVKDIPGYERNAAPSIQLNGPSTRINTEHYLATQAQRKLLGGTYGLERRIAYTSLKEAGLSVNEAKNAVRYADKYFMDKLGMKLSTITRVPGNRLGIK
jgi:RHS repeat-associated protein